MSENGRRLSLLIKRARIGRSTELDNARGGRRSIWHHRLPSMPGPGLVQTNDPSSIVFQRHR